MATKAPLAFLTGKVGLYGKAGEVPVHGNATISKSHGVYMLRAAIRVPPAEAKELDANR